MPSMLDGAFSAKVIRLTCQILGDIRGSIFCYSSAEPLCLLRVLWISDTQNCNARIALASRGQAGGKATYGGRERRREVAGREVSQEKTKRMEGTG